jgi:hypothetical protein
MEICGESERRVCQKLEFGKFTKYYGETNSENQKHGYGCCLYGNGEYYEGEWANDLRCGKGGYVYPKLLEYVGDFRNDKMHGYGIYKVPDDGSTYVGSF